MCSAPASKPPHDIFFDAASKATFGAPPTWAAQFKGEPGLEAGCYTQKLLDPRPIFKQCGFYKDALLNGGKNNDQPQWNLAVLGTTFYGERQCHRAQDQQPTSGIFPG
jgi:hypothetical protein